jgi:hypothetical protein
MEVGECLHEPNAILAREVLVKCCPDLTNLRNEGDIDLAMVELGVDEVLEELLVLRISGIEDVDHEEEYLECEVTLLLLDLNLRCVNIRRFNRVLVGGQYLENHIEDLLVMDEKLDRVLMLELPELDQSGDDVGQRDL